MIKTNNYEMDLSKKICVTRKELPALLGCGQPTADKIAAEAGAKFYSGKRLLICVEKVRQYLSDNCR